MTRPLIFALVLLSLSCREPTREEYIQNLDLTTTSSGTKGVGSPSAPVEKMIQGVRFQQKGLEIEDVVRYTGTGRHAFADESLNGADTLHLPMLIRGWNSRDGIARFRYSSVMRSPDGRVAHQYHDFKTIGTLNVGQGDGIADYATATDVDSTVPYYDCEFTITDIGNGRSLSGTYRLNLKWGAQRNRLIARRGVFAWVVEN